MHEAVFVGDGEQRARDDDDVAAAPDDDDEHGGAGHEAALAAERAVAAELGEPPRARARSRWSGSASARRPAGLTRWSVGTSFTATQLAPVPGPTLRLMDALADVVFGDEGVGGGFAGDRAVYYDPRNSLLSSVVRRRRGIPLSLAVVLVAVARRLGLPMHVIGSRGHVLVALAPSAHADDARDAPSVAPSRRLYVDVYDGARTHRVASAPRCSASASARRPRRRP